MIVTVTLNPSLDKSGVVSGLVYDDVTRVRDMNCVAGGKGVNVSRVLRNFGVKNVALGFAGGSTGKDFLDMARGEKLKCDFTRVGGPTRTNWTLFDEKRKGVVKLNEPGPEIGAREAEKFLRKLTRYARKDNIFVVTGSLPGGLDAGYYGRVLSVLSGKVRAVFWDSEVMPGKPAPLPDFMKPNVYEAERILKMKITGDSGMARALRAMKKHELYPFISAGPQGLSFEDVAGGFYNLKTPKLEHYTLPGAGDSFTAGFCAGYARDLSFFESVRLGTACAAATVANARFANPGDAAKMLERIVAVPVRER